MKKIALTLILFSLSCTQTLTESDKALLREDKANKILELQYLEEIKIAEENQDRDAFKFFFEEYIKVPRLKIPEHLKEHPSYFKGGKSVKY